MTSSSNQRHAPARPRAGPGQLKPEDLSPRLQLKAHARFVLPWPDHQRADIYRADHVVHRPLTLRL
jgi:hypothetical protein